MSTSWDEWLFFGGEMPSLLDGRPDVPLPDSVLIVDRETGCAFFGEKLIHTDKCKCDEDDRQEV